MSVDCQVQRSQSDSDCFSAISESIPTPVIQIVSDSKKNTGISSDCKYNRGDISSITRKVTDEQGNSSCNNSFIAPECNNEGQSFNSPSFAADCLEGENNKENEHIEITFNCKADKALFDIQKTQLEILESHRLETRKLQQKQNKLHIQNHTLIAKLNKVNNIGNPPNICKIKRESKELKTARQLRTHSLIIDGDSIKTKLLDTDFLIEKLKEQQK